MKTYKTKVFISHSWQDKPLAQEIEAELAAAGVEVWVDHKGIRGGDNLPEEISNALQWCDILLLIWSKASSNSYWVKLEWTNAIALRKAIIPCRIDETELPAILANKAFINFSNVAQGITYLLNTLITSRQSIIASPSAKAIETEIAGREIEISYLSSTQSKIVSILSNGPATRIQVSRALVSTYGSETRPAQVSRQLEMLIKDHLVIEEKVGDAETVYKLSTEGHRKEAGTKI